MTLTQALLSLLGTIILTVGAVLGHRWKSKSDDKSSSGDLALNMIKELREEAQLQKDLLTQHQKQIEEIKRINEELRQDNRQMLNELRDERELNEDVLEWIDQWDLWTLAGANPPPPPYSWRMQNQLDEIRRRRKAAERIEENNG